MKTIYLRKTNKNFNTLIINFELQKERPLTNSEIKNILKVVNRPGYLNGIKKIFLCSDDTDEYSKKRIIAGIKGKMINPNISAPNPIISKEISFYEKGVELGYQVHERYPL